MCMYVYILCMYVNLYTFPYVPLAPSECRDELPAGTVVVRIPNLDPNRM